MKQIIITVGYPGSGKTSVAEEYTRKGYQRLNRDTLGGTLDTVAKFLLDYLENGTERVILDNTYPTAASRSRVLKIAAKFNIPVKCLWMKTSIEDAQRNICTRMMQMRGKILTPDEIKKEKSPNIFSPAVLFRYRKIFEKPTMIEGFSAIEEIPFVRRKTSYTNQAIIFDYDGTLRRTKSGKHFPLEANDIVLLPGRKAKIQRLHADGFKLLGMSNQSGVSKGTLTAEDVEHCLARTNRLLGVQIEATYCPHKSNPLSCWCRKPMPGKGVYFTEKYKLDPSKVTMVGDMTSDKTFAKRSGFNFIHADKFFTKH